MYLAMTQLCTFNVAVPIFLKIQHTFELHTEAVFWSYPNDTAVLAHLGTCTCLAAGVAGQAGPRTVIHPRLTLPTVRGQALP
jgi:hypothetical protein